MITTTHILVGAAIGSRPHFKPWQITLAWLGGFVPDASVFLMVAATRLSPQVPINMWRKPDGLYWQEPWQTLSAISNSIPMWALFLAIGYLLFRSRQQLKQIAVGIMAFSSAALAHVLCDLPVHTDDAHVHFWPFTDWRFHSPVSYYQSEHFGSQFRIFEMGLTAALVAYLWWRFPQKTIRILAVTLGAAPFLMRFIARAVF